jgi:hypothetical protein
MNFKFRNYLLFQIFATEIDFSRKKILDFSKLKNNDLPKY